MNLAVELEVWESQNNITTPHPKEVADGCHRYSVIARRPPPPVPYISYNEPPQLVQMLSVICRVKAAAAALIAKVLRVSQY